MFDFIDKTIKEVRTRFYKNKKKTFLLMLLTFVILSSIGFLFDSRENIGKVFNFIRTFFISLQSVPIFFIFYLLGENRKAKHSKDENYVSPRKKYTFNQRRNLAIIVSVLTIFLHIVFFKSASNFYSLSSATVLAIVLNMIYFTRKTKYELELDRKGYVDARDLEHLYKLQDKEREKDVD